MFSLFKKKHKEDRCSTCEYLDKKDNTCYVKKCSSLYPYVDKWDRKHCKFYKKGETENV